MIEARVILHPSDFQVVLKDVNYSFMTVKSYRHGVDYLNALDPDQGLEEFFHP